MLATMLAKIWGERRSRRARCAQTVMSKVEVASIQRPWTTTWIFWAGPVWLIGLKQQSSIRSWCLSKWQTLMKNVYLRRFVRTCLIERTQRVPRNSSFVFQAGGSSASMTRQKMRLTSHAAPSVWRVMLKSCFKSGAGLVPSTIISMERTRWLAYVITMERTRWLAYCWSTKSCTTYNIRCQEHSSIFRS